MLCSATGQIGFEKIRKKKISLDKEGMEMKNAAKKNLKEGKCAIAAKKEAEAV